MSDHARVLFPPPLLYAIPLAVGITLHFAVGQDQIAASVKPIAVPLGIILLALGGLIGSSAARAFKKIGTPRNPYRPTRALVIEGPFRFTRNPMYLAMALIYLGISLIIGCIWPLVFLPFVLLVVDRFVIRREETYLEEKFGDPYRRYRATVRRWI